MSKPKLMEGFSERQGINNPDRSTKWRWSSPLGMCGHVAADTARRVSESKTLFEWEFYRGDCHSHTQHSDGIGTVAETAEMVHRAELDFQFVTDHWGVTQAPECKEHNLWVGQEPVTQFHHMGILGLDHAFTPQLDLVADYKAAQEAGATVFIPHPTGWFPVKVYDEEQKQSLQKLPDNFLMEIINGAGNIINAFDYTDASAVELWDELLNMGRTVHAMGNTDAHSPHAIGMVWNGVFSPRCTQPSILKALRAGHSFVSDGPLMHIQMGETEMGDAADKLDKLNITVVDSHGLAYISVVADGHERKVWPVRNETKVELEYSVPRSIKRYVRVQALSLDGRRAFSNPIYLK